MFDSRFASRCPEWIHRTYAPSCFSRQADPKISEIDELRSKLGMEHESRILESFRESLAENFLQVIGVEREQETLAAIADGQHKLLAGAELGSLAERHAGVEPSGRVGKPDLLLRISDGWVPIDIKNHSSFESSIKSAFVEVLAIGELITRDSIGQTLAAGRLCEPDAMQLSHYWVQLEHVGLASSSGVVGILGKDGAAVAFQSVFAAAYGNGKKSAIELYRERFDRSKDVFERSRARERDAALPKAAEPRLDSDCKSCEFRETCLADMKAWPGGGHPTLLAGLTPKIWREKFSALGSIEDAAALACDVDEASRVIGLKARSRLDNKVYALKPLAEIDIPVFDIEIDIDLENSQNSLFGEGSDSEAGKDVVFQYGWIRLDRRVGSSWSEAPTGVFESFANNSDAELTVMLGMWNWCKEQIAAAEAENLSIGFFHYSPHEIGWWKKFAERHRSKAGVPTLAEVESFCDRYMYDLLPVAKQFAFPAKSYSIKDLAPLAGFRWPVEDPGGEKATLEFLKAVDPSKPVDQLSAQKWLTEYNRGDVQATMCLREWLRDEWAKLSQSEFVR